MATGELGHQLERARWAASAYGEYDKAAVDTVVSAVGEAAAAAAAKYAQWAVQETNMGVAAHKEEKNLACSRGLVEHYRDHDLVTPRICEAEKIASIPTPAGVVLALTPSTNPVATVYFKVLLALMTRNAVIVAPHPRALECCVDATHMLAEAATAAGAPDGIVQVVERPTIPLLEELMADPRIGVTVATGGTGVVRAAYSSGNPALGVGPGNVPVLVDRTADLRSAAEHLVASKAFDNSVLCTNESVLIVEDAVADSLATELRRAGGYVLTREESDRLRNYMYPDGSLNTEVVGRSAEWIAERAGMRVTPKTKVLVAPFDLVVDEDGLAHEKLSPVLGMVRVAGTEAGIDAARAVVRIAGAGHTGAIHSNDPDTVLRFGVRVPVLRICVNVGSSTGGAGLDTGLAPSMTIGTGFAGHSSVGENLRPDHLVNWTQIAYNADSGVRMPDLRGREVFDGGHRGPVPEYPVASNERGTVGVHTEQAVFQAAHGRLPTDVSDQVRAELRRIVMEELAQLGKG